MGQGDSGFEPVVRTGSIDASLAAELPGLVLRWTVIPGSGGPSHRSTAERLRALSDRFSGTRPVFLRAEPIVASYRAFFRQVGLDPDVARVPAEQVALARLFQGGLVPCDRVSDACLIAAVETGVGVWALDAQAVQPASFGILQTQDAKLAIADDRCVHATLFSAIPASSAPNARTRRIVLFAVGVAGVPAIHLDEALWLAAQAL